MKPETKVESLSPKVSYNERFTAFLRSRRGKMFGLAEVAALAGSCFVLALVLLSYLSFLAPARSRLASLKTERNQTQVNLKTLSSFVDTEDKTQQTVDKVAASLSDFESRNLARQDQGRMDLYGELNQLILKNGLRNTAGPTYTTLDPAGTKSVSGKSVTTKWQSFYPGVAVLVTVEGQYQNLRRFIHDIERSKQFVVINEVELQRATQNSAPSSAEGQPEGGSGSRGSLVSLQLNLAAYFRRENAAEAAIAVQE